MIFFFILFKIFVICHVVCNEIATYNRIVIVFLVASYPFYGNTKFSMQQHFRKYSIPQILIFYMKILPCPIKELVTKLIGNILAVDIEGCLYIQILFYRSKCKKNCFRFSSSCRSIGTSFGYMIFLVFPFDVNSRTSQFFGMVSIATSIRPNLNDPCSLSFIAHSYTFEGS